ncbi:uncharacterized protein LOC142350294 isoform X2 [Convolutriloba macropyga]|uniref:uncharacterized protein LOC142350294 isoform X2 n=1 Tax=Convolutriloba macropyga TaxID=536237 RepID=UPI003F52146D
MNSGERERERERRRVEQIVEKKERQMLDLRDYYEGEIEELTLKLQSALLSPSHNSDALTQNKTHTDEMMRAKDEEIASLRANQEKLHLANDRIQQLTAQLAMYQSAPLLLPSPSPTTAHPPPPPALTPASPTVGYSLPRTPPPLTPTGTPHLLHPQHHQEEVNKFAQDVMKYSHLSMEELRQLHSELKAKLNTLRDRLHRLPPGGHLTPQDKRQRRQWNEKSEELEAEVQFVNKLLRKLERVADR